MDEHLSEVLREAGLPESGFEEVAQLLAEARSTSLPPVTPSDELRALWAAPAMAPPRRSRRAALVALGILCGFGAGTAAAAANVLPSPVQEAVADFSDRLLPFSFPHPDDRSSQPAPSERVPSEPAPSELELPGQRTELAPVTPGGTGTGRDGGAPGDPDPTAVDTRTSAPAPGRTDGPASVDDPSPAGSGGAPPSAPPEDPPAVTSPSPTGAPGTSPAGPPGTVSEPPEKERDPGGQQSQQAPQMAPQVTPQKAPQDEAVPDRGTAPAPDPADVGGLPLVGSLTGGLLTTVVALLPGGRS